MSKSPSIIKRLSGHLQRSGSISDADSGPPSAGSPSARQQRKEERRIRRASSAVGRKGRGGSRGSLGGAIADNTMDDATFREEWHMTKADEVKVMVQFLTALQAAGKLRTDYEWCMYRRFLRARQHDIPRATEMWSKHLAWRGEIGADTILEDFEFNERDAFISLYPQGYCNVDKMGRPVYIQQIGQLQFKKLQELTTEERMMKFHVQEYERCVRYILPACSMAAGKNIEQTFAILDLKGVGIRHLTGAVKKMLQQIIQVDQSNYPEMLGKTAIINGGSVIGFVFPFVRPFLDKRTQNKIEVCPRDFRATLLQHIDAANLPEYLGGDSRATLLDDAGPWNDPHLVEQIEAELRREGPKLRWPPEAQSYPVPPSIASSLAGGSPRAGSAPESGPVTPHSTAHIAVSQFRNSAEIPRPNGISVSQGVIERGEMHQTGHMTVLPSRLPIKRQASSGSDVSAISADGGYASADGGYMSASDGYASATESLASFSSMGSVMSQRTRTLSFTQTVASQPLQPTIGSSAHLLPDEGAMNTPSSTANAEPPRSASRQLLAPRANIQYSICSRVQALEARVREVHRELGTAAPKLPPMPATGGPLMVRVEALEIALETLLAAEQANQEAIEARSTGGCCGSCCIM